MSMGGCYVSINKKTLNSILESNSSLYDYMDSLPDSETHTVEQAWDGINSMLKQDVPNVLGFDNILEDVDLGEQCSLIDFYDKEVLFKQFQSITEQKLLEIRNSNWYQEESFYWDNIYKNNDELIDEILKLKTFIEKEFERKDNILLFWIT